MTSHSFTPKWTIQPHTHHVKLSRTSSAELFGNQMNAGLVDVDQALKDRTYADALQLVNNNVGEVVACFGRYKSKTFNWIIENDPGYVKYLWKDHRQSDEASLEGAKEFTVFTWHLAHYAHSSFPVLAKTIDDVLHQGEQDVIADRTGDDSIRCVKFGIFPNISYQDSYDSTEPRHIKWLNDIRKKRDVRSGTSMFKFKKWVLEQDKVKSGTEAPDAILSSLPDSFLAPPKSCTDSIDFTTDKPSLPDSFLAPPKSCPQTRSMDITTDITSSSSSSATSIPTPYSWTC